MATKIRLARAGRRNLPFYHIVIADSRAPRDGKFIENIGYYDPILQGEAKGRLNVNMERANYWLGVGAEPTERVAILLGKVGIAGLEKFEPTRINKKPPREKRKR